MICDQGSGLCVPRLCERDAQCGFTQYCDLDEGRCAEGCRIGMCAQEERCDRDSHLCTPGCLIHEDCALGNFCNNGTCDFGCRQDSECFGGEVCQQGLCQPASCQSDADCPLDAFCDTNQGMCQGGCRTSPDTCSLGTVCDPEGHSCVPMACRSDANCAPGFLCIAGAFGDFCTPACRANSDCGQGQRCVNQECTCQVSQDCPGALGCEAEVCVSGCLQDSDCFGSQTCNVDTKLCNTGLLNCQDDLREYDNDIFSATSVGPGSYDLMMCALQEPLEFERDCLRFTVSGAGSLVASVQSQSADLDLFLLNANGIEITSATEAGLQETLTQEIYESAQWYICVQPTSAPLSTAYTITLDLP